MNALSSALLLMTPGPTRVPERILAAGARPMIHHRTDEFSDEVRAVVTGLGPLIGTSEPVLPVHATGRGGTEAVIANLFSAGDEIVACCNGRFGEMWARIAEAYGVVVRRVARSWLHDVDLSELDRALSEHPAARGVTCTYTDTSTGALNDVHAIAAVAHRHGALAMVDGVSAVGGVPLSFDEWGLDVVVMASQKCLMSAPGLAFVALSARAWDAYDRATLPRRYWDLGEVRRHVTAARPNTPGTPPVPVMLQVAEALRMIAEEGLAAVCARHDAMGLATRAGAATLGVPLLSDRFGRYAPTVTALAAPPGIQPRQIREGLGRRGILVAGGLENFDATSFRIGHMGDIRMADVERTLTALGEVLGESGRVASASAESSTGP